MIEQWTKAQAIGLAAYGARAFAPHAGDVAEHFGQSARQRLPGLLEEWGWDRAERMRELPTSVLHMLAALDNNHVTRPLKNVLQQRARDAITFLTPRRESPLSKAIALAHHIMYGTGSAVRITRLGASLFGDGGWSAVDGVRQAQLESVLIRLRNGIGATGNRRDDVEELLTLIGGTPVASQIAAALLNHLYCWPLLVFPGRGGDIAVGLPLAVDVDISAKPTCGRHPVLVKGDSLLNLGLCGPDGKDWPYHLHRARYAAKLLWLRAHGNAGSVFREQIKQHQVVFDFGAASRAIGIAFGGQERLPLIGGSAAAYLSQVVLARLLGRRWYLSSAVTGRIGLRVWDEETQDFDRDFEFWRVGGTAAKVRHVFQTRTFERIVVPNDQATVSEVSDLRVTPPEPAQSGSSYPVVSGAEVLFAAKLSNVADIVQVEGWRKTTFVRCPEISWTLHGAGAPGPLPVDDVRVSHVLDRLVRHRGTVMRLEHVEPVAVASALYHVNRLIHEKNQPHSPPGLSWCIMRAVREEQDASFWRTLWRVTGAPLPDYELLRDSPTLAVAARRAAHALNRFAPTEEAPAHRAPDILVVVGAERFLDSMRRNRTPLARPLAFHSVLERFEKDALLEVSVHRRKPECATYAGEARIILVGDSNRDPWPQEAVGRLSQLEIQVLEALCTFRFGFSQQMASQLLAEFDIHGGEVRDVLKQLVTKKALREHVGQFHLTQALWSDIVSQGGDDLAVEARRHYAAGVALAPYTVTAPVPALAYDMAFLPENVVEASVHLVKANDLYKKLNDVRAKNVVRRGLLRLCRFAALPHWGAVDRLNRAKHGRDAYELAKELMEGWQAHPDNTERLPSHPNHFVEAIEALMNCEPPRKYLDDILNMCEEGLAACERYPSESAFNRLKLLCGVSVYLYRHWPDRAGKMRALDDQIWALRDQWGELQGDWFEKNGDMEPDDRAAVEHYQLGTRYASEYCQNWVKCLGAASLARLNVNGICAQLSAKPERDAQTFLWHVRRAYGRDIKRTDPSRDWVMRRYNAGQAVLRRIWPRLLNH